MTGPKPQAPRTVMTAEEVADQIRREGRHVDNSRPGRVSCLPARHNHAILRRLLRQQLRF